MKYIYIFIIAMVLIVSAVHAQNILKGTVLSSADHKPLAGSLIKVAGRGTSAISDDRGNFQISIPATGILIVRSIGYRDTSLNVNAGTEQPLLIYLHSNTEVLREVSILSNGYQQLAKERATGSFSKVDQRLFNRRVSTNILSRLEDVVPGLIFNREPGAKSESISIRGQNTINANDQPLIILDNFPYEGDISSINPNDIDHVTILKDAAAASIWGARAGNGVIVLTSKKGKLNAAPRITLNTNLTIGQRPDLYSIPFMSTADYINTERRLFSEGYYGPIESSVDQKPLTSVVELMIAKRDGKISSEEAERQIEMLKNKDVRTQYQEFLLRPSVNQQYAFNLNGGSTNQRYFVSAGYDKNLSSFKRNDIDRITVNANQSFNLFKGKLELSSGFYFSKGNSTNNNPGITGLGLQGRNLYPYAALADVQGQPLEIPRNYRSNYIQQLSEQNPELLDWAYRPLQELETANNETHFFDLLVNSGLKYNILKGFQADILYQYGRSTWGNENIQSVNSYYTRNLINEFSLISAEQGLTRNIPLGGILDQNTSVSNRNSLRVQLSLDRNFGERHYVNALAGTEVRGINTLSGTYRLYGYDEEHATSKAVDYVHPYPYFIYPEVLRLIPNKDSRLELTDRYLSYYSNVAYTYDGRITLSASARIDKSNLFGVNANQKGVPLWSIGGSWNISREKFYSSRWLPELKLRATYGYSGNIDKTLSAYTTALYYNGNDLLIRQPYATILNPPNPELRWEKISTLNFGMDFATKEARITGTIDYYTKKGIDLIGETAFPQYTGIRSFRGNTSNILGKGLDFILNTVNTKGKISWVTNYLFSYATDKVTNYRASETNNYLLYLNTPMEGRPLYGIYSYKWGGIDGENGNPQGYLADGSVSEDYSRIIGETNKDNIVFSGRARPLCFGAVRNTVSWRGVSLSANISYRLGYYFRRYSIQYGDNYGLGGHGDYYNRWQQPGDEQLTQVPSMPTTPNFSRDQFYQNASELVERGDHIRLQDLSLSYDLPLSITKRARLNNAQIYIYGNNLGLLWSATDQDIDPDYLSGVLPKTIAIGLKLGL